jgi:hypothetical protein
MVPQREYHAASSPIPEEAHAMDEVYALKYAERDTPACQFFYREASHEIVTLHYFVWLIPGGPHPVLTGHDPEVAERSKPGEPGIIRIA